MHSWLLRFTTIINLRRLGKFQCALVYLDDRWTYGGVTQSQSGLLLNVDAVIIIFTYMDEDDFLGVSDTLWGYLCTTGMA